MILARTLLPLVLLSSIATAADWPQYRGPVGNGTTAEKVLKPWTGGAPKSVWKAASEGGFSSFAVGGGKAFTLSLKEVEGAKQEALIALDAATGKELWIAPLNLAKYDGGGRFRHATTTKAATGRACTPTIVGDTVVALSSQLALRCFDAATGKVLWTRDLMKEHNGRNIQWQNAASPLLEGGLLYVGGGGQGESLLAIDPEGRRGRVEGV